MANIQYYDVILKPVVTEKTMDLMADKKYTFLVHTEATKSQIKEAVEKIHYLSELTAQGTLRNDLPEGTLYYAHKKVKNHWTKKFERVKVIHQHVFYKEI